MEQVHFLFCIIEDCLGTIFSMFYFCILQTAPESSAPTPPTAAVVSYKKQFSCIVTVKKTTHMEDVWET